MPVTQDKKELLKQLLAKKANKAEGKHFPLSYGQRALWFLHQNAPDNSAYNVALAARIKSEVSIEALKKACQRLTNRHPVLRTTYDIKNGELVQTVHGFMSLDFSYLDASHLKDEAFDQFVRDCYHRSFHLEAGPVSRVFLIKQAENDHVFLYNIHHIACDGVSTWILLEELRDLYAAEIDGEKPQLQALDRSYKHFVEYQHDLLEGDKGQKLWAYWKKQLSGDLPTLDIQTDHARPLVQTFKGASADVKLSKALTDQLRELGKKEGATLYAILASAFQVLLHRYSGQEDILLGTPTTGRDKNEFSRLVGYFVNPVVLRAGFDDNPTFSDFLNRNKKTILDAIGHQDFPFPYLVEKLNIPRDKSRSPIFQAFFSLLKSAGDEAVQALLTASEAAGEHQWGKLKLQGYKLEQQEGQFDLAMALTESKGEVSGKLKYNSDLFEAETIHRMADHFINLLEHIAQEPTRPVNKLNLLSSKEKEWLAVELNQTQTPFPEEKCMHQLFEERADKYPDNIAVSMPAMAEEGKQGTFTYADLDKRANQVAHYLQSLGVGPEVKVGLCVDRSPEMIIGILGVLKAGGAYVPLDPDYPQERLAYIIEDAGLEIILTQNGAAEKLSDSGKQLVWLDKDVKSLKTFPSSRPQSAVNSRNLAYIIYTSGSTGKPKGVLIEHKGVANKLTNFKQDVRFTPDFRFTLLASYAFDASIGQMFMPLVTGSPLFLMPKDKQNDPEYFWDFIFEHKINVLYTVASFLSPMLDVGRDLKGMNFKCVFLGAEVFPLPLLEKIRKRINVEKIVNMYGPTETTVNCVMHTIERIPKGSIPLGRALPNYTVYILDQYLNIQPVGVPGEIHIGGPAVARGYHNRPELTDDRFIPDPFSQLEGARLYKSGDLGKYLPDGNVAFMGRVDKQVKVNGFRIEPGEVEAAILQHEAVKEVMVQAKEDHTGSNRLVAYLIPEKADEAPSIEEMRSFLTAKLPKYMIPTAYVALDKWPLLPSGKVNVNALPAPGVRPELSTEFVEPRTREEKLLAGIWSEVLNIPKIGIHDNFFDLGGASVQSIQVVNKANEMGFQLDANMMFEFQTIEELALKAAENFNYKDPAEVQDVEVVEVVKAEQPKVNLRPSFGADVAHTIVESIGTYLPPKEVTTQEILDTSVTEIRFPLEKMTGIKTRRMAGEEEFAIDMAIKAVEDCLSRSKYEPGDVELLICCNISRYDAPAQVSFEPSSSARLRKHFGMNNALVFDLSNACATLWTAVHIIDSFISNGIIKCGMAVSGEYISHISETASKEIEASFMDPRIACFTVGDSGAAVMLERSPKEELGFHHLHIFTESELCRNCIAHLTNHKHGGAIMYVESVKAAASAIQPGAKLVLETIKKGNWLPEVQFDHLLMHQTSSTTISDARREINAQYKETIATKENMIDNIAHRGNTATTSHWLAIVDQVKAGKIKSGDKIVFGISGSGHSLGAALYTFDDLPDRILLNKKNQNGKSNGHTQVLPAKRLWETPQQRISIESIGILPENKVKGEPDSLEFAKAAVLDCIDRSDYKKEEVGLIINTGIYRNKFLQEPAIASLVAGDLNINSHPETDSLNKSFSFDLMNSSIGFMEACYVSTQMLQAGKFNTALVVASEIENNAEPRPDDLLGIRETGSAMLLHWDEEGSAGFGNFVFKNFPAYLDTRNVYMTWHDGEGFLAHLQNPNMNQYYIDCIQKTVNELLELEGISLEDVNMIFPPQVSPGFITNLATQLGTKREKFVDVSMEGKDLFTSSLAYGLRQAQDYNMVKKGDVGLLISIGAGIQVGVALYYF
jgi:amino acid adenylation domain-containing protein